MDFPYLTTAQMIEVDRSMIEDFRIELIQMMENAGRNLAHLARTRFFDGDPRQRSVIVLAGRGGNGGGALVCARRLHTWGANVRVVLARAQESMNGVPRHQLEILHRMGVRVGGVDGGAPPDLIVDGLIGYSLKGAPKGEYEALIHWANDQASPTLSLDVPSGVDASTGAVYDPAIRADATLTLALPKQGLNAVTARAHVGELYLADICVPPALYAQPELDLDVGPIFAREEIIRVR